MMVEFTTTIYDSPGENSRSKETHLRLLGLLLILGASGLKILVPLLFLVQLGLQVGDSRVGILNEENESERERRERERERERERKREKEEGKH